MLSFSLYDFGLMQWLNIAKRTFSISLYLLLGIFAGWGATPEPPPKKEKTSPSSPTVTQKAKPHSSWKTTASLGAALTRGNSDTVTIHGSLKTSWKREQNEVASGAQFTYGEEKERVAASSVSGYGQYNRLFSNRFYLLGRVDARHDDMARLAYRVKLSPGAGYYFLKNKKFTLQGELGPSFVFERLGDRSANYWTLRIGENFTWQINERARSWQRLDYSPQTDDFADYVINAEVGFEADITQNLALRVVAMDTYRSKPAPGREENDFKLITGVSYKF